MLEVTLWLAEKCYSKSHLTEREERWGLKNEISAPPPGKIKGSLDTSPSLLSGRKTCKAASNGVHSLQTPEGQEIK